MNAQMELNLLNQNYPGSVPPDIFVKASGLPKNLREELVKRLGGYIPPAGPQGTQIDGTFKQSSSTVKPPQQAENMPVAL